MFRNQMLDMIFAPWTAKILACACRLKIFDLLAEKSMTAGKLAGKVRAVPRLLKAVLDALTAMGFLRVKNNRYTNSYLSNIYLVAGNPFYLGDIIDVLEREAGKWDGLFDLVTGGTDTGKGDAKKEFEPDLRRFTMGMNNLAMQGEANALADAVDLSGCKELVDVGCGSGIYSVVLCRHYPGLHAQLLDMKEVLQTTARVIETYNLQDRIKTHEADITMDSYGERADVVLLSDVLYQEQAIGMTILRSAYRALRPGGTLLVRGYYSDPGGSDPIFGSIFTINILLNNPDREIISIPLLCQWIEQIGFHSIRAFPLTERSTCITAKK